MCLYLLSLQIPAVQCHQSIPFIITLNVRHSQGKSSPQFHPDSSRINLHKIANRHASRPSEIVTAMATGHRTSTLSTESWVNLTYQAPRGLEPLGLSSQYHTLSSMTNKMPVISYELLILPLGEICLQVTVGSGLPVAMQVRLMLFPSLMEISEEISTILGDTVERKQEEGT